MPAIALSISEEDLTVALKVLQSNIAEGEAHAPKKHKKGKNKTISQLEIPPQQQVCFHFIHCKLSLI